MSTSNISTKKPQCYADGKLLSIPEHRDQLSDDGEYRERTNTSPLLRYNSDISHLGYGLRQSVISASQENVQDPVPDLDVHIPIRQIGETREEEGEGGREEVDNKSFSSASSSSSAVQDPVMVEDLNTSTNLAENIS